MCLYVFFPVTDTLSDGCHGYHVVKLNSAGPSKHYSYTLEVPVDYLVDSCFSIRIYFINKSRVDYSALLVYLPEFYPKQNIDTQTIGILRPAIDLPSHLFWGIYSSNFGRCSHIQTTKTNNRGQYMAPTQTKHYCRLL